MAVESGLPEGAAQGQLQKAEGEGGEGPSPRRPRREAGPDPEEGQGAWRGSRRTLMALLFIPGVVLVVLALGYLGETSGRSDQSFCPRTQTSFFASPFPPSFFGATNEHVK